MQMQSAGAEKGAAAIELTGKFKRRTNSVSTTKYGPWAFLPMNVLLQFTKSYNLFFLLLCCIVLIPGLTPFSGLAYISCVVLVVSISVLKDGLSEIKRHRRDQRINREKIRVVRRIGEGVLEIPREDVNLGELLVISEKDAFPMNAVVLLCKGSNGSQPSHCFVETSSVDGESSMKRKFPVLQGSFHLGGTPPSGDTIALSNSEKSLLGAIKRIEIAEGGLSGRVVMEQCDGQATDAPFNEANVVLKGCTSCSSDQIIVVSIGNPVWEEKKARLKNSIYMRFLGKTTGIIVSFYLLVLLFSSYFSCKFLLIYPWIAAQSGAHSLSHIAFRHFTANVIVFSSLIPISLFVTLEGLRVTYSVYVHEDPQLEAAGAKALCNSFGLIEDMGIATHVLCDKTGTLTKNQMVLKGMHVSGQPAPFILSAADPQGSASMLEINGAVLLVMALALCNSLEVDRGSYRGTSQEEVAIMEGLKEMGVALLHRTKRQVHCTIGPLSIRADVLSVMSFDPSLSRMGVLVVVGGRIFLLEKGSDEVVCNSGALPVDGRYRTLTVAGREVGEREVQAIIKKDLSIGASKQASWEEWRILALARGDKGPPCAPGDGSEPAYSGAQDSVLDQVTSPRDLVVRLESALEYLGTVYIEDVLQDKVKDAITELRRKDIKVWMITGDRRETAVSCALATGMFKTNEEHTVISGKELIERLEAEMRGGHTGLGASPKLSTRHSLVSFRSSPYDKARIIELVRKLGYITIGIGDGENDVGMIEESDVGIGVIGKEGRRAVAVADVVVPSFHPVARLILFHGCVCLARLKTVYFFYIFKSVSVAMCQFLYGACTGASGSIASSSLFLLHYNALITSPMSVELGMFRTRNVVKSVYEAIGIGALYGTSAFMIVYSAFERGDMMDGSGRTIGHPMVSRIFSSCLFISAVVHFLFASDSFVSLTPLFLIVSFGFFLISIGFDGGFEFFGYPAFYLVAILMVGASLLIERLLALVRGSEKVHGIAGIY